MQNILKIWSKAWHKQKEVDTSMHCLRKERKELRRRIVSKKITCTAYVSTRDTYLGIENSIAVG